MTAMRKEPERRYATARQLADDIEHHLAHRPMMPRAPIRWPIARRSSAAQCVGYGHDAGLVTIAIGGLVTLYTLRLAHERDQTARERATARSVRVPRRSVRRCESGSDASRCHRATGRREWRRTHRTASRRATGRRLSIHDQHGARVLRPRHVRSCARGARRRARAEAQTCARTILASQRRSTMSASCRVRSAGTRRRSRRSRKRCACARRRSVPTAPVGETLYRIGIVQHRIGNYPAMGRRWSVPCRFTRHAWRRRSGHGGGAQAGNLSLPGLRARRRARDLAALAASRRRIRQGQHSRRRRTAYARAAGMAARRVPRGHRFLLAHTRDQGSEFRPRAPGPGHDPVRPRGQSQGPRGAQRVARLLRARDRAAEESCSGPRTSTSR